jgi:hypothetical protein
VILVDAEALTDLLNPVLNEPLVWRVIGGPGVEERHIGQPRHLNSPPSWAVASHADGAATLAA